MSNNVLNYGWKEGEDPESCDYLGPAIKAALRKYSGTNRICDLGCGSGRLVGELLNEGYQVAGVELDTEGCRITSERNPGANVYNLGVEDSYLSIVEKEDAKFDAVVSTEVIEHLYSPHLLPQFVSGILKPSGILIITTPYHGFWKNLALSLFNKWDSHHTPLWHGGHIKFWSKATLSLLLEDNGYEVVGFSGVGRVPYLWKSMLLIARLKES